MSTLRRQRADLTTAMQTLDAALFGMPVYVAGKLVLLGGMTAYHVSPCWVPETADQYSLCISSCFAYQMPSEANALSAHDCRGLAFKTVFISVVLHSIAQWSCMEELWLSLCSNNQHSIGCESLLTLCTITTV